MSNIEQHTIDKLFRDLSRVYSTSATSMIGLDSVKAAIEELVCKDNDFIREIIKAKNHVQSCDLGEKFMEIDTLNDYKIAKKLFTN